MNVIIFNFFKFPSYFFSLQTTGMENIRLGELHISIFYFINIQSGICLNPNLLRCLYRCKIWQFGITKANLLILIVSINNEYIRHFNLEKSQHFILNMKFLSFIFVIKFIALSNISINVYMVLKMLITGVVHFIKIPLWKQFPF